MVNLERVNKHNLKETIESLLLRYFNGSKDKVLIKPNWGGRLPIILGENTDPHFLKILIEVIAKRNVKKIYVAHYPLLKIGNDDYSFKKLLRITKVDKIRFPRNVEFLNLEEVEKEIVNLGEFSFSLPKILKEVFYIDLAKLKTHIETKVSLCMKNQMGMLPTEDKLAMHTRDLERGIALLATQLKPDLCIIDGIISMDKNGPHHGRTRKTNILLYSDNLLEIDYLTSYLMGYNPREVKHINYAIDLGVGRALSSDVIEKYNKYRLTNFILPKECLQKFNLTIWPTTACSKCIFNSDKTQKYLKRDLAVIIKLLFAKNKTYNVVMGKGDNIKNKQLSNIIAIGECTKGLAKERNIDYLRGCPPTTQDIFKFMKKSIIK
jgi:uncharacterized protein (DUF362 family)